jgi:UDP-N-acetyl-D-galactosamine dehydrogenase
MGMFVANKVVKLLIQKGIAIKGAKALVLGVTFKENCPDIRNSKVVDIYRELNQFGLNVDIYDPHVDPIEVKKEYNIEMSQLLAKYDAIVLAVAHEEFLNIDFNELKNNPESIVYDIKSVLDRKIISGRL